MRYASTYFQKGFTVPELVVVIGILSIIFATSVLSLTNIQQKAYLGTNIPTVLSDVKQQQLKAMYGDTQGTTIQTDYGIYLETNRYVLFRGSTYSPSDPGNYSINLEANVEFVNVTFPQSQIVFTKGSGEVSGFTANTNTFTMRNSASGEQRVITINRYGVIETVN